MPTAEISILDLVKERLLLITTANGYHHDVVKVKRGKLTPFKERDLPGVNYWIDSIVNERTAYKKDKRTINLAVAMWKFSNEDLNIDDSSFVNIASEIAFDVVTALNRGTTKPKVTDPTDTKLGGMVTDLVFERSEPDIGEGQAPWVGAIMAFTITYLTDYNNMLTFK